MMNRKYAVIMVLCAMGWCYSLQAHEDQGWRKKITVVGTGYVGLVTGSCLAQAHDVICCDIDQGKIDKLNAGIMPIVEPGLEELVKENVQAGRLTFSADVPAAIRASQAIFIAVGTPMADDGSANLSAIMAVARTIADNLNDHKVIITKSTVPIGTGAKIRDVITQRVDEDVVFDVASNPEFLREGCAVGDFLVPDRIVIGVHSSYAEQILRDIYRPWLTKSVKLVVADVNTAEAIKYASNAFLAVKISYINEFSNLCDALGVDVMKVAYAMGLDDRIGPKFLQPGPGYGGSCFPKDTQALAYMAEQSGVDLRIVNAAIQANDAQRVVLCNKISTIMDGDFEGKEVAVLGLAFKPDTDDIRYSPALEVIEFLKSHGAHVRAYDPAGQENMKEFFPDITYCSSSKEAYQGADLLVLMTEWAEFKKLDLGDVAASMRAKVLVDARNIWAPADLIAHGFAYENIGRRS